MSWEAVRCCEHEFIVLMENVGENVFNPIQLHFIVDVFFSMLK